MIFIMFENILFPSFALMVVTMVVGFYHTYGTMNLMQPGKDWEEGIPSDPYAHATENLQMIKNNIKNLFEFPIIFYLLSILIYSLGRSDNTFIYLAWIYVLLRTIHSIYHIFLNNNQIRGGFWLLSQLILFGILIRFLIIF